ncbi:hypothetical protein KCU81_g4304, partial [Aureobasidium melanogenum]|uniref:peptidylprolyl isomerase n=1 Tax=Aureobasidium melanogenum (strain CBS 110374) TaxID=1043003 RepID=A0A074VQC4_AURM1
MGSQPSLGPSIPFLSRAGEPECFGEEEEEYLLRLVRLFPGQPLSKALPLLRHVSPDDDEEVYRVVQERLKEFRETNDTSKVSIFTPEGNFIMSQILALAKTYYRDDPMCIHHRAAEAIADALCQFVSPFKSGNSTEGDLTTLIHRMFLSDGVDVLAAALVVNDLQSPERQSPPEQGAYQVLNGHPKIWSHVVDNQIVWTPFSSLPFRDPRHRLGWNQSFVTPVVHPSIPVERLSMASEIFDLASDERKLRYAIIEFKKVYGTWYASRVSVIYHMVRHGLRKITRELDRVPSGPDVEVRTYTYGTVRGSYISARDGKSLIYSLSCNNIMEDPTERPLHEQLGITLDTLESVPDVFKDKTFLFDVMSRPVLTSEGQSFELISLHKYLEQGTFKDPITKTDLNRKVPSFVNKPLQIALAEWIKLYKEKQEADQEKKQAEARSKILENYVRDRFGQGELDRLTQESSVRIE